MHVYRYVVPSRPSPERGDGADDRALTLAHGHGAAGDAATKEVDGQ